jgi:hypothetical protein
LMLGLDESSCWGATCRRCELRYGYGPSRLSPGE